MSALNCFSAYWIVLLALFLGYFFYLYVVKPSNKKKTDFVGYAPEQLNNFLEAFDTVLLKWFGGSETTPKQLAITEKLETVKTCRMMVNRANANAKLGFKNSEKLLWASVKELELSLFLLQEEIYSEKELYLAWRELVNSYELGHIIIPK